MTDLRALLAPIHARLASATPGPWEARDMPMPGATIDEWFVREIVHPNPGFHPFNVLKVRGASNAARECCWPPNISDAKLIANAPTDLARLLAAIEAVTELADAWQARGEHLRKSAESAPEDVQEVLDDQGGDMIWHAGLIRTALAAALGSDTTNQEGTQ